MLSAAVNERTLFAPAPFALAQPSPIFVRATTPSADCEIPDKIDPPTPCLAVSAKISVPSRLSKTTAAHVGADVGVAVGVAVGVDVGVAVGAAVGVAVGEVVGVAVGSAVGVAVGAAAVGHESSRALIQ